MTGNDLDLATEIRRLLNYSGKLNHLIRERMFGNLEDALLIIQLAAREARRRLRKMSD